VENWLYTNLEVQVIQTMDQRQSDCHNLNIHVNMWNDYASVSELMLSMFHVVSRTTLFTNSMCWCLHVGQQLIVYNVNKCTHCSILF